MENKDEILEAVGKRRREKSIFRFFKEPIEVIREKPLRVGYISGIIGGCLMLITYVYELEFIAPYDAYILAGIAAVVPPAYYSYREQKRINQAEDEFPNLLRDLAQAKMAGLSLIAAVTLTAEGEYGILTDVLKKIAAQLTWGVSFEDALRILVKRYPTPMIKRSVEMIIEGYRTGGEVGKILKIAADDAMELKSLEKRRLEYMSTYTIVCYATFFVFLGVLLVLYYSFIPMMAEAAEKVAEAGGGAGSTIIYGVDIEMLKMIFFHCAVIQGICSGLVAGKLGAGRTIAGLTHAVVLALSAFGLFAVLEFMLI
ncbi:MAG: type II secretion system F family protein [Methanosarcinales archaeon]|nr:type II secretion system F family protein [Methanosarcinales archaeon]